MKEEIKEILGSIKTLAENHFTDEMEGKRLTDYRSEVKKEGVRTGGWRVINLTQESGQTQRQARSQSNQTFIASDAAKPILSPSIHHRQAR